MEQKMTGMDFKIREVAQRIRELREISGFTVEEMAQRTNLSVEEYIQCEAGNRNLSIAFLYPCTPPRTFLKKGSWNSKNFQKELINNLFKVLGILKPFF